MVRWFVNLQLIKGVQGRWWFADLPSACIDWLVSTAHRTLGAVKPSRGHRPDLQGSDCPTTRLGGVLEVCLAANFSYIRPWRVILLRSDIRLRRVVFKHSRCECLSFLGGEYNTTASGANNNTVAYDNITPTKSEYHLHKDRDFVKVFVLFYLCESIDNFLKMWYNEGAKQILYATFCKRMCFYFSVKAHPPFSAFSVM